VAFNFESWFKTPRAALFLQHQPPCLRGTDPREPSSPSSSSSYISFPRKGFINDLISKLVIDPGKCRKRGCINGKLPPELCWFESWFRTLEEVPVGWVHCLPVMCPAESSPFTAAVLDSV
jgi:hypothetical protein